MTTREPGRILRRALVAWGLGHLALGHARAGRLLLAAEIIAVALVAWLTVGLADSSLYLVPFLAGVGFIVVWAWQAVDAYATAHRLQPGRGPAPERSPAAAIAWLSLPMLVWGSGFWLAAAGSASPGAILDRFVTAWTADELGDAWPAAVVREAEAAAATLGPGSDRFHDIRVRVVNDEAGRATAVAESIHFERLEANFLWVFPGSELVPVTDRRVLTLELVARPVELPGGGEIGAVRWELVDADAD